MYSVGCCCLVVWGTGQCERWKEMDTKSTMNCPALSAIMTARQSAQHLMNLLQIPVHNDAIYYVSVLSLKTFFLIFYHFIFNVDDFLWPEFF